MSAAPVRRRVAVVGGGVAGLTAAWSLQRTGVDVVCLEASERVGGKLRAEPFGDGEVEVGADSYLARHGAASDLVRQLGLDDQVVAPASGQVWLWLRGRLRPLPEGTVLGAPTDLGSLVRSGVLTLPGLARAAIEPFLRTRSLAGDVSLGDLVGARFGHEVVDVLVEPLLGGVYAGNAQSLSARATAPMVAEAGRGRGSMLPGLLAHRRRTMASDLPVFQTLHGGLATITDRMAAELGAAVRTATPVDDLEPRRGGWTMHAGGEEIGVDDVVLATPADVTGRLIASTAPAASVDLLGIRYASVGVVTLAYDEADAACLPEGSGMLVPRTEGRLVKASTWVSRKWPHRAQPGRVLLRASVGRVDDTRWLDLEPAEVIERADAEIRWATGIRRPAIDSRLTPWLRSLPQYDVGHQARVERVRACLPAGLHLAGAAYDGVGISPCIASGHAAAYAAAHA